MCTDHTLNKSKGFVKEIVGVLCFMLCAFIFEAFDSSVHHHFIYNCHCESCFFYLLFGSVISFDDFNRIKGYNGCESWRWHVAVCKDFSGETRHYEIFCNDGYDARL